MALDKRLKIILIDTAGALLIIASALLGWLPGPGGVPLLLAGLSLLAINHTWARRWIDKIKHSGHSLMEKIFSTNKTIELVYDLLSLILITGATWLFTNRPHGLWVSAGISIGILGLTLLFGNRKRWQRFKNWLTSLLSR